jgi:hypothetical protein
MVWISIFGFKKELYDSHNNKDFKMAVVNFIGNQPIGSDTQSNTWKVFVQGVCVGTIDYVMNSWDSEGKHTQAHHISSLIEGKHPSHCVLQRKIRRMFEEV